MCGPHEAIKSSEQETRGFIKTAVGVATIAAAKVTAVGAELRILELEIPNPGPGKARVKV